jgi:hypothetical protein
MHDGQNTTNSKSADAKPLIKGCLKQSNAAARWGSLQRGGQLHNARGPTAFARTPVKYPY